MIQVVRVYRVIKVPGYMALALEKFMEDYYGKNSFKSPLLRGIVVIRMLREMLKGKSLSKLFEVDVPRMVSPVPLAFGLETWFVEMCKKRGVPIAETVRRILYVYLNERGYLRGVTPILR